LGSRSAVQIVAFGWIFMPVNAIENGNHALMAIEFSVFTRFVRFIRLTSKKAKNGCRNERKCKKAHCKKRLNDLNRVKKQVLLQIVEKNAGFAIFLVPTKRKSLFKKEKSLFLKKINAEFSFSIIVKIDFKSKIKNLNQYKSTF
jgi:hypothetical protein